MCLNRSRLRETIALQIERSQARDLLRAGGKSGKCYHDNSGSSKNPNQPPPKVIRPSQPRPFQRTLTLHSISDYLFPNSWQVSEDGNTIFWRRFWLPGFFRYLPVFTFLLFITLGGITLFIQFTRRCKLFQLVVHLVGRRSSGPGCSVLVYRGLAQ